MTTRELLGVAGVLAALVALLGALGAWQRRCSPHPELPRKLAHVGMGLTTLCFPRLFDRAWPVWALGAASAAVLAAARWWAPLRPALGGALGRVGRGGGGEFYFALAVAAVFTLSRGAASPSGVNVLFVVPILLLTLADAAAALAGARYGLGGGKSVEGSLAFFATAFCCAAAPLCLWGGADPVKACLIGLLLGLLMTLLEAVCEQGTDNLCVPLAGFATLRIYLGLSVPELTLRLGVLAALAALLLRWPRQFPACRPRAAALLLYLGWSLA